MFPKLRSTVAAMGAAVLLFGAGADRAAASLVVFQSYTGNVAVSTDGFGSSTNAGVISASAPAGSTVVAAYLYTSLWSFVGAPTTVSFDGNAVTYDATFPNTTACCSLTSSRKDVTGLVASVIDGGAGGVYDFQIDEGAQGGNIDGHALVVVYANAALPEASVGILDGFSAVGGDTASINFASPLDPNAPGFFAEMALGIGFSCCSQSSNVSVNGTLITQNAGNFDDGNAQQNGSLITVGGFDDPFSPLLPGYGEDHERYDLKPYVSLGDLSIKIDTNNPTNDDNIFLATFYVSGKAKFVDGEIPLPASIWLMFAAVGGLAAVRRRSQSVRG